MLARLTHVESGQPIPETLMERMRAARFADMGFETVEFVSSAILDMDYHSKRLEGSAAALNRLCSKAFICQVRSHFVMQARNFSTSSQAMAMLLATTAICGAKFWTPMGSKLSGKREIRMIVKQRAGRINLSILPVAHATSKKLVICSGAGTLKLVHC